MIMKLRAGKSLAWVVSNPVIYFHLKDAKAANRIVNHLVTSPKDSILLPFSDYPGPLTREILSRKFKSLTVCERDSQARHRFQSFQKLNYPEKRVHIHPDDLFEVSIRLDSEACQKRCTKIVEEALGVHDEQPPLQSDNDNCDKHIKLLVPLLIARNETGFLRSLYNQVCMRMGLASTGMIHYYFLLSERHFNYIHAKAGQNLNLYRSSSVLYNTIFNIKNLDHFSLEDCFGISVKKLQNTAPATYDSYKRVHLVLFEPKLDVIQTLGPRASLEYRYLVTQMMTARRELVVHFLSRFFHNYQDDIASIGVTNKTRSGDLKPHQYYQLFLLLRRHQEYVNSTFVQAVASAEEYWHIHN